MSTTPGDAEDFQAEVRVAVRARSRSAGALVLPMVAALYATLGVLYVLAPPLEPGLPFALCALGAALLYAALSLAIRDVADRVVEPLYVLAGLVSVAFAHSFTWLTGDPEQTVVLVLTLLGFAAMPLSPWTVAIVGAVALSSWLPVAQPWAATDFTHWSVNLTAAALVAALIAWSRRRLLVRLERETLLSARTLEQVGEQAARLELQSRELLAARDTALESTQVKSQFLAKMSHEMRTPMHAIIGVTDLLLASELSSQARRHTSTVRDSALSLLELIDDVLDFSKIEAGRLELHEERFSLRAAVEDVLELVAERAHRKGIEVVPELPPDLPAQVLGDGLRFRQILLNLVGNAVKFTEQGEVRVRLQYGAEDGSAIVRGEVQDTGIGIPPEALPRLFHSFSQVDESTTRRYGGTGLGLAISRSLCELMHGSIGAESAPAAGSTFWFQVRLRTAGEARDPVLGASPAELQGVPVVVAAANDALRSALVAQLRAWGAEVRPAGSAAEAFAATKGAGGARVLLCDLWLPDVDGASLGRALARDSDGPAVVLLAPVNEHGQAEAAAAEAGGVRCLFKPVRPAALLESMRVAALGPAAACIAAPARPKVPEARVPLDGRVLVVEDEPVNQMVAVEMLELLGLHADVAHNGVQALEAVQGSAYDVVLMDCMMPEMDGFEAAARIRGLSGAASRTPIVAMTANALEGDRERCMAAGMDDYLPKPVTLERLADAMRRWVAVGAGETGEARPVRAE